MIELRDMTFAYGPCEILQNLSMRFPAGTVTALLGPNGSGKSTLLRLISGELHPLRGQVLFQNRPIREWKPGELAVRRALLPQAAQLEFSFSVIEVVLLGRGPHMRGSERPEDVRICQEALSLTGMLSMQTRNYMQLSGGERQRVQLARVLAQCWEKNGQALLLDEPTAALDLAHRHDTLQLARDWAAGGAAVVVVMHDLNLALSYADDAAVIYRGGVATQGPCREVLTEALVEKVFEVRAERLTTADGAVFLATSSISAESGGAA